MNSGSQPDYRQTFLSGFALKRLTIIVKHSIFGAPFEGATSTESDRVREERYSVHCSLDSKTTNVIKYTRVLYGDKRKYSYQNTEAIKVYNQFAIIFMRRSGDLSDSRYLVNSNGPVISLGSYDPAYFQIAYMVLVAAHDRKFVIPRLWYVKLVQIPFARFRLIVLWQFMSFTGDITTRSVMPVTFSQEQISAESNLWSKVSMAHMSVGSSEVHAMHIFTTSKYNLAHSLIDTYWRQTNESDKTVYEDMKSALKALDIYTLNGTPFSDDHIALLRTIERFINRRRKKRSLST